MLEEILCTYRGYKNEVGYVSLEIHILRTILSLWRCPCALHQCWKNNHVPVRCQFEGGVADARQESELHSMAMLPRTISADICSSFSVASAHHGPLYRVAACRWCFFAYVQWWSSFIYHWFLLVDFIFTIYLCFIACWVMARLWISSLPRCRFLQVAEHTLQTAVGLSAHFNMRSFFSEKKDYVVSIYCLFLSCSYVSSLSFYFSKKYICTCSLVRHWIITQFLHESIFLYHILLFCCIWPLLFSCRIVHAFSYEENI